ncbi:MAG: phosphate acyltransferase [Clostridium sp.]|nr:phosphate acyltransferase [Clostridium sp.]
MKTLESLARAVAGRGKRKKAAIVWASDETTRQAVAKAMAAGIIDAVFVGCRAEIEADKAMPEGLRIVDAADPDQAAALAVGMARQGEVGIIMKGMINTDNLLRAILNKETGILDPGAVLTHVTAAEIPAYRKVLLLTDVAVIPYPTLDQRRAQIKCLVEMAKRLGRETPKIALTHCSEKVDERHFPFTADYVTLKQEAEQGKFGPCVVDGPLDVKTSLSPEALEHKGLHSPLQGDSDALVFPDIEAGNTFYKTITLFAGANIAGLLVGAKVPVVLSSRGDDVASKYFSLAFAAL